MKIFILMFTLTLASMMAGAQLTVKENDSYKVFEALASDTLSYNSDTTAVELKKTIFFNKPYDFNYYLQTTIAKGGSGDNVSYILRGSMDGSTWTAIDTTTWSGSTSTTTVTYQTFSGNTGCYWRFLQQYFKSDSLDANMAINKTIIRVLPK